MSTEHRSLLVVYVFNFYQTLRVVPHGMKGTGPGFVTRPVYLRSQLRNNTNTVSVLVLLIHLLQVHYRFFVHGTRVSHITGRSRPPDEVGLTPRQYTEWNVMGARSLYRRSLPQCYWHSCVLSDSNFNSKIGVVSAHNSSADYVHNYPLNYGN